MRSVEENGEAVVVQDNGQPRVAIISMGEFDRLQGRIDPERRQRALADLRALRDRVRARAANQNLTPEQAEEIADRFVR